MTRHADAPDLMNVPKDSGYLTYLAQRDTVSCASWLPDPRCPLELEVGGSTGCWVGRGGSAPGEGGLTPTVGSINRWANPGLAPRPQNAPASLPM